MCDACDMANKWLIDWLIDWKVGAVSVGPVSCRRPGQSADGESHRGRMRRQVPTQLNDDPTNTLHKSALTPIRNPLRWGGLSAC